MGTGGGEYVWNSHSLLLPYIHRGLLLLHLRVLSSFPRRGPRNKTPFTSKPHMILIFLAANPSPKPILHMRHTPLPTHLRLNIGQTHTPAMRIAHGLVNLGKVDSGHKALGLPGLADFFVQFVYLFETEALSLVDHEVDEGDADEAEGAPDEEDFGAEVGVAGAGVDHVWGGEGDGPVEEPGGM